MDFSGGIHSTDDDTATMIKLSLNDDMEVMDSELLSETNGTHFGGPSGANRSCFIACGR